MPNIIRFPFKDSGINTSAPKYCFINVENIFDITKITQVVTPTGAQYASGLRIAYNKSGSFQNDLLVYSTVYYKDHLLSDADVDKLRNLVKKANKSPNSAPLFEVIKDPVQNSLDPTFYHVSATGGGCKVYT